MHNPRTLIDRHAYALLSLAEGCGYVEIGGRLRIRFPDEVRSSSNFNAGQNAVKALLVKFGVASGNEAISAGFRYGFVFWSQGRLHYSSISLTADDSGTRVMLAEGAGEQLELPLIVGNGNVRAARIAGYRATAIA